MFKNTHKVTGKKEIIDIRERINRSRRRTICAYDSLCELTIDYCYSKLVSIVKLLLFVCIVNILARYYFTVRVLHYTSIHHYR